MSSDYCKAGVNVSKTLNINAARRTWSINISDLPPELVNDEKRQSEFVLKHLGKNLCLTRKKLTYAELSFLSNLTGVTFYDIADACGLTIQDVKFWEKRFPVSKKHSALMIPFFLKRLSLND
jgi:hypothetical protein